jgi:hypothetical protein
MDKNDKRLEIENTLDLRLIDQLHNSTLNFSKASLEIKKLLFVLFSIAIPVLIQVSDNKIDMSLFVSMYVCIILFWILDAFTYYYQEKLREKMDRVFLEIKKRNNCDYGLVNQNGVTIEKSRSKKGRLFRSLFNSSSLIMYPLLLIINTVGLILYKLELIA